MSRREQFTRRLRDTLAAEEARYAEIEARVLAAREAGVDTSKFSPPSAQSADMSLAKAEARVAHAAKALKQYEEQS